MSLPLRSTISRSWERTARSGLLPTSDVRAVIDDADVDSALVRAARPVIEDLAEQLEDTACALILADRSQRIVVRRFGDRRVGRALDEVAAVPGSTYSEQTTGTNAISTVFETGEAVFVLGEEHYLDKLQRFRCYGRPIVHPITGVLEGVLDLTGVEEGSEGLMRALIVTAARAIEGQLLLASPSSQVRLLSAYQARAARSHHAVLAFGRDITLCNDVAGRLVDDTVVHRLRSLCLDGDSLAESRTVVLPAADGRPQAVVRIEPVEGAPRSFVVEVSTVGDAAVVPRRRAPSTSSVPRPLAPTTTRRLSPLEEAEYRTIVEALERHGGNKSHVADELGIGRSTLYRRLRWFGVPT